MTADAIRSGWSPACWLGAPSPGGLSLPDASPTADHLYAPRGVWLDAERLVVCDSGNHRILVWDRVPDASDTPPDWCFGQPSLTAVEPNRGGGPAATSLYWPYGLAVVAGRLHVADTGNNRVTLWRQTAADQPLADPAARSASKPSQPGGAGR